MASHVCFRSLPLPSSFPSSSSHHSKYRNPPPVSPATAFRSLHLASSSLRFNRNRLSPLTRASIAVDVPGVFASNEQGDEPKILLEVKDLTAVISESKQQILKGVNLVIREGEVHAIMGKNGSGKSTLSKVLVGHPDYEVTGGSAIFKGENLFDMDPEDRSLAGIFMSFQSPVEIPGVNNSDFLRMAYNARMKKLGLPEIEPIQFFQIVYPKLADLKMDTSFLNRNVNEGFSGGERKRNEILQLAVLGADLAILDEIDSGLDVDALQDVAKAVNGLLTPTRSVLMVTHYKRLLDYITPKYVHIMEDGKILKTGDISIAKQLEKEGFKGFNAA